MNNGWVSYSVRAPIDWLLVQDAIVKVRHLPTHFAANPQPATGFFSSPVNLEGTEQKSFLSAKEFDDLNRKYKKLKQMYQEAREKNLGLQQEITNLEQQVVNLQKQLQQQSQTRVPNTKPTFPELYPLSTQLRR